MHTENNTQTQSKAHDYAQWLYTMGNYTASGSRWSRNGVRHEEITPRPAKSVFHDYGWDLNNASEYGRAKRYMEQDGAYGFCPGLFCTLHFTLCFGKDQWTH